MAKKRKVKRRRKISTPNKEWTTRRLEKAEKILTTTHVHEPFFSQIVFWSAILVIVIGNLIMSIALIPFLTVLNKWFLDMIIIVLGLVMGILFNFLIIKDTGGSNVRKTKKSKRNLVRKRSMRTVRPSRATRR